jgi:ribosomal protein L16 Arg81 hydroxylase
LRSIFFAENYYDDRTAFDSLHAHDLCWLTATVEEGDALYIPPLWWHGVVPLTEAFGATAAVTWRSPIPIIANAIRKMAAGNVDMVGKHSTPNPEALREAARRLGLEREFSAVWERGF